MAAVVLAAAASAGCGGREEPGRASAAAGTPVPVAVHRAGTSCARRSILLPGRVTAREEVTIRSRITARLVELPYEEGSAFPSGAVLARFTAPETRAALDAARAGLASAALRLDLARKQEARIDSLHGQRVAALRELELARQERQAATAEHAAAGAAYESLASGILVRAPFAGIVVRHHMDPGTTAGAGEAVLDVRSRSVGDVVADVPEAWAADLSRAAVFARSGGGAWSPVVLRHLDGTTDYATRTRTARFRPLVPLDTGAAPAVGAPEAGDFAQVRLEAIGAPAGRPAAEEDARAMSIPAGALIRRGSLTGLYVVRDRRAWLRWVRIGRSDADRVEVLAGLEPGEDVVLEPEGLADGAPVSVESVPSTAWTRP
jgi:RND family efflux transporter MFP subunit